MGYTVMMTLKRCECANFLDLRSRLAQLQLLILLDFALDSSVK
jgi:hypothetical protein